MTFSRIQRQTYTATLPDGSQPGIISGTYTEDDSAVPYIQSSITIPTPGNAAQLDPRGASPSVQPPRVTVNLFQEFAESASLDDLSSLFPTQTLDQMSTTYPTQTLDALAAIYTTAWNTGNELGGRAPVDRNEDLAIIESESNDDGTTTLTLQSDEAYAIGDAGVQLATWAAAGISKLSTLVQAALSAIMPVELQTTFDFDLTSAIASTPAQTAYADTVWNGLDTYVQLAAARLYCDGSRMWHLDRNLLPQLFNTVYTEGFEGGTVGGWAPSNGLLSNSTAQHHTGTHALRQGNDPSDAAPNDDMSKTITGLTVGATYFLTGWVYQSSKQVVFTALGVDTGDVSPSVTPKVGVWTKVSVSFTATATSHVIDAFTQWVGNSSFCYWDDFQILTPIATTVDVRLAVADTIISFSDTLSRASTFASIVKVVYNWTTSGGNATSQVDTADGRTPGVPGVLLTQTNDDTPFPGAGAAAAILVRTLSYGHEIDVTAVSDLAFKPRQNLALSIDTGDFLGTIAAVTFDLAAKTMAITSRNMA